VSWKLCASTDCTAMTIRIAGPLDFRLASIFGEICHQPSAAYTRYVVDLTDVNIVRDSGLALLLMLNRWATIAGVTMSVINGSFDLVRRCKQIGIAVSQ
jgi:ABC-type transporter Mla MlaB component